MTPITTTNSNQSELPMDFCLVRRHGRRVGGGASPGIDSTSCNRCVGPMLTLLSPAKIMDFESPIPAVAWTTPRYLDRAWCLVKRLRAFSSGLYGVFRPLDLTRPYRLEMGASLETDHGRNLYDFWRSTITTAI